MKAQKQTGSLKNGQQLALRLLALRDHSREEIRRKLTAKGLAGKEIEEALKKLEARRLVDDFRYAQHLAFTLSRDKLLGRQRIGQRLSQKGIPGDLAQAAIENAEGAWATGERLQELLKKKLKGRILEEMSLPEKKKLFAFLLRRGFLREDVAEALEALGGFTEPW